MSMLNTLEWLLMLVAAVASVPAVVVCVEVLASLRLRSRIDQAPQGFSPSRFAVLVPAHNEESLLPDTLENLKKVVRPDDRIVVIADNCTDATEQVAKNHNVEVVCRFEPALRGKGYALDFGIKYLAQDPPEVVVFIDADCRVVRGTLTELAAISEASGKPVQALDTMVAAPGHEAAQALQVLAWRLKNYVRPLGMKALGLPCQLAGTGMAIPWRAIAGVNVRSGELAEDLKLGVDLAINGQLASFYTGTEIVSAFPVAAESKIKQQQRWEIGSWRVIARMLPLLLKAAITRRSWRLLGMACDISVPPLLSYAAIQALLLAASVLLAALGMPGVFWVSAAGFVLLSAAIACTWTAYSADLRQHVDLSTIAGLVMQKVAVYRCGKLRGGIGWERTARPEDRGGDKKAE